MTSNIQPSPQRPWVAIVLIIILVVVALNLVAYLWFRSSSAPRDREPVVAANEPGETRVERKPTSNRELALEQREAGIEALRSERYDRASVLFEAARRLDPATPDIETLLELARKMGGPDEAPAPPREVSRETPRPNPQPAPERAEPAVAARRRPPPAARRRAERVSPRRAEPPAEARAELFVTTVPDDLLIEIDGRPAAISPARIQLPVGTHTVRLRQGPKVLLERSVTLEDGEPKTLEADVRSEMTTDVAQRDDDRPAQPSSLGADPEMDLVALVEQAAPEREGQPSASRRSPTPAPELAPSTPRGAAGRLVVVWPGSNRRDLARALRPELGGVVVDVVASTSRDELTDAGAVLAAPSVLRELGLGVDMRATPEDVPPHVAVSLTRIPSRAALDEEPVGILDQLGPRRASVFVGTLLGTSSPPPVRRVGKPEDLLSLLQLGVVNTVLVERSMLARLAERTQRELFTLDLEASPRSLAVGFVGRPDNRDTIVSALGSLSQQMRRSIGVRTWTQ